jgi:nitrile hydratase subunit beta
MRYRQGERVRVSGRPHPGHHRTPGYLKGRIGTIERPLGSFKDPETRAYGGDGLPARALYTVAFAQKDIWPDYGGAADDRLWADLYEHWLEPSR